MPTGAKTALMVIAPEQFRDEELNHPREVLAGKGVAVTVASTKTGALKGMLGHVESVRETLDGVAAIDFDAVVVVGGAGSPAHLWDNARLREIVLRHHAMGKVVAAICLSGAALAKAGILRDVEATVFKTDESIKVFNECGAVYRNRPVVRSGNTITASGPAAAREFGREIARALGVL